MNLETKKYKNYLAEDESHHINRRFGLGESHFNELLTSLTNGKENFRTVAEIGSGACHHIIDSAKYFSSAKHYAFEPAPDMYFNGFENVKKSALENIVNIQCSVEDIPSQYDNFFDLSYSIMVAHFTLSLENYFSVLKRISKNGSYHLLVDANLPEGLNDHLKKAFGRFFSEVFSFRSIPLSIEELCNLAIDNGFKVIRAPLKIEKISEEIARKKLESIPQDQEKILVEVANEFALSNEFFFTYDLINIYVLFKL